MKYQIWRQHVQNDYVSGVREAVLKEDLYAETDSHYKATEICAALARIVLVNEDTPHYAFGIRIA